MLPELANQICATTRAHGSPQRPSSNHEGPAGRTSKWTSNGAFSNTIFGYPSEYLLPELLCRELLSIYPAESYSRFVVPRATPELSCRELLPSCCAERYSQSIVLILVLTMRWMSLPSVQNALSEAPKHTHKSNSEQADLSKVVLCSEAPLLDFSEAGGEQLQATSIWPAATSRSS